MTNFKIGVLVSGRGSNLQAVIDACEKKEIKATVGVVISNKKQAPALERAQKASILTEVVLAEKGQTRQDYDRQLIAILKKYQVNLVVLAGFMRLLSKEFLSAFPDRVINIHPALLPAFPGLEAQKQALEAGATQSGATVHLVDEGCDTGPIIMQSVVSVLPNDTLETLSERILIEEHKLLPKVIDLFAQNKVKIVGRKVEIL